MQLQGELPSHEEAYDKLSQTAASLQDMNMNKDIPILHETQQSLESQLAHASEVSDQLENKLLQYNDLKQSLGEELKQEAKWLSDLRDKLQDTDDTSASDEEMVDRLNTVKVSKVWGGGVGCGDVYGELESFEKHL